MYVGEKLTQWFSFGEKIIGTDVFFVFTYQLSGPDRTHNDLDVGVLLFNDSGRMRSIHTRHTYVHDDKVDRCALDEIKAFLTFGDAADQLYFPVISEKRNERFFEKMVIINDQRPYFVHPYSLRSVGNEHLIVVPLPSLLLIEKEPLIRRARSCIESNP